MLEKEFLLIYLLDQMHEGHPEVTWSIVLVGDITRVRNGVHVKAHPKDAALA